jgi:periplasmic divalent cation tolerance protein
MTDLILIYITCESADEAKKIGKYLLEKRLCGCVNIFPDANPMFWWPPKENKLDESKESVLLVKTLESKFEEIENEVRKIHSFDTPCLIAIPVLKVNQDYYDWIKGEINLES